jgi:GNAT superfamily N-acetyltransferase
VSEERTGPERYDPKRHDPTGFSCGKESLDRWLVRNAGQSQRRDAARTFVITTDGAVVGGYCSLVAGQITHDDATEAARRGLSRHFPIPVAILARLAVDQRHRGRGLGAVLLNDAFRRVSHATELVAVRAVVVHALDDEAAGFYRRFGFRALSDTPRTLMVTLRELRDAGY